MSEDIFDTIRQAAHADDKRVKLDFTGVELMTPETIKNLVEASEFAKSLGVDLRMANVSPMVREVFEITKLNKLINLEECDKD
jgi:anti-anti-sigma factor